MKRKILISFALTFSILLFPLLLREGAAEGSGTEQSGQEGIVSQIYGLESSPGGNGSYRAGSGAAEKHADSDISFLALTNGDSVQYTMDEYLPGLIAAEMPAGFEEEALKAQAVAARTYVIVLMRSGNPRHPDYAVCDDYACCAAFMTDDELRARWGSDFDEYHAKICLAVSETDGEYLTWEGEPIEAVFHSSSAGSTEDSAEVWGARPYLISVSSPETERDVPNFVSTVRVLPDDFRKTILGAYPSASLGGDPSVWLGKCTNDTSGRVAEMEIGGALIPGTGLRSLFSLRSTAFTLAYQNGAFLFTATGYGHGVGMSQYGANVMAEKGSSYDDILSHYYPGTALVK